MPDPRIEALTNLYQINPSLFQPDELNLLQKELGNTDINFTPHAMPGEEDLWDTSIGAVTKLFNGFVTGFTTIPVGEAPKNTTEAIFENVGHLLGFIGYIPGLGSVAKAGAMGIGRMVYKGIRTGEEVAKVAKIARGVEKVASHASVPMVGAELVMKGLGRSSILRSAGAKTAEFLSKRGLSEGVIKSLGYAGQGAAHLGVASAIGASPPWELAVDERIDAFIGGAIAGGTFRGLGIMFPNANANIPNKGLFKNIIASAKDPKGKIRIISSMIAMGLPSTMANAPVELQVYQYLTGLVFGAGEMSRNQAKWLKDYYSVAQERYNAPITGYQNEILMKNIEANFPEVWKSWPKEVKDIHKEQMKILNYRSTNDMYKFVALGQEDAVRKQKDALLDEYNSGAISLEQFKERLAKYNRIELGSDLVKELDLRVEDAVLKDLADERNTMNRGQLELYHSERIHDQMLGEIDKIANEQVKIELADAAVDNKLDVDSRLKDVKDFRQWTIEYALENKELITPLVNPGREFAYNMVKGKNLPVDVLKEKVEGTYDAIAESVKANEPFPKLLKRLEKLYDEPITREKNKKAIQDLTKAYNRAKLEIVHDVVLDPAGRKLVSSKEFGGEYSDGSGAFSFKANTQIKEQLEKAGYKNAEILTLKRVLDGNRHKALLDSDITYKEIEDIARENGYSVFGGVKDTRKLVLVKHLFDDKVTPESVIERFADDPIKANHLEELLKIKDFQTEKEYTDYAKDFANNILVLEALNEAPVDVWYGNKNYISSAKDLNKRMSLLMNGFTRMEPEFFKTLDNGNMRTVILNTVNKGDKEQVPGKDITYKAYNELKEVIDVKENTHLDGAHIIRSKTFDEMGYNAGSEEGISGLKGTLMHADKAGGLYGKFLYHRATPELDKWMEKNNIHSLLFTDSVKQLGNRKSSDWQWSKGNLEIDDMTVYDIPIKSFTVIEAGEHRAQMGKILEGGKVVGKDPIIPVQMMSVTDKRFPHLQQWLRQKVRKAYKGDQTENDKANAFLSNRISSKEAESIDIDKLGLPTKLRILFKGEDNILFRRLVDDILKTDDLESLESMVIDRDAYLASRLDVNLGTSQRLIQLGHTSPAELHSTLIQPYYMKALTSAVIKQVTRPKNEGGWISKLHPAFGEILEKHDFKPGTILIPKELADKKLIPWLDGKEVTISEALKQYKKSPTPAMESLLEVAVQRVPTDAVSGIRMLRIIGTVDMPGSAMWMHPRDMKYEGGADLDGDAAFVIPRMPKEAKEEFKKVKDEYHDKNDVFVDAKPENSPFRAKVDPRMQKILKNPASIFDGEAMSYVNESASEASRGLGSGISTATRMNGLFDLSKEKLGILKRKSNRKELQEARHQFINLSADASEGSKLVDMDTVRDIFMEATFTKKSLAEYREFVKLNDKFAKARKAGQTKDIFTAEESARFKELKEKGAKVAHGTVKAINSLSNVISGRAYRRGRSYKLGLDEVIDRALAARPFFGKKRVNDAGQEYYDEGSTNPYYFAALTIARLDREASSITAGSWVKESVPVELKKRSTFLMRTDKGKQLLGWIKRKAVNLHNPIKVLPGEDPNTLAWKMAYNEKLSQDGLDGAYFPFLNYYVKKMYPETVNKEHLESIRNHAQIMRNTMAMFKIAKKDKNLSVMDTIKKKWDELYAREKIDKTLKLDLSDSIGKANRTIDHYIRLWKTGRTQAEKDLYDAFLLNPFREQDMTLNEFIKWGENLGFRKSGLKKTWNESDAHGKPWESGEISDKVISKYMDIYKEDMQKQPVQKIDQKTRDIINEMVQSDVIDEGMEYGNPIKEFITSNWNMHTRKFSKEVRAKLGEKKGSEAEETLRRQVREFLEKFPHFTHEMHALTEGILLVRNGELMETTPAIETATPDQLIYVGNVLEGITKGRGNPRAIKRTDYFFKLFPSIGREFIKWDPRSFKSRAPVMFTDKEGKVHVKEKEVIMLTSTMGEIGDIWHKGALKTDAVNSSDKNKYMNEDMYKAIVTFDEKHKGLGSKLYTMSMINKQLRGEIRRLNNPNVRSSKFPNVYVEHYKKIEQDYRAALASDKKFYIPHLKKSITQKEFMEMVDDWTTDVWTGNQKLLYNPEAVRWFEGRYNNSTELGGRRETRGNIYDKEGYPIMDNWVKAFKHYYLYGKGERLGIDYLKKIRTWWMLEKNSRVYAKSSIEDVIRDGRNRRFFDRDQRAEFLANGGKFATMEDMIQSPLYRSIRANEANLEDTPEAFFARKFIRLGDDVLRESNESILLSEYPEHRNHFYRRWGYTTDYYEQNLQRGAFDREWTRNYYAQMEHDPKVVKEWQRQRIEEALERGETVAEVLTENIDRINASRSTPEEAEMEMVYNEIMSDTPVTENQMREVIGRFGSAESRAPDDPTPGWTIDPDVPIRYTENLNKLYYKFISNFVSEYSLKTLEKTPQFKEGGQLKKVWKDWIQFATIFNRNQMGMPSIYPKSMLENKDLKLKNNPYFYFTDQPYEDLFNKVSAKWFKDKSLFAQTAKLLTKEQYESMSKRDQQRIGQMLKAEFGRKVNRFSQLEAKWEFLSLLTHTKTFVANIVGGNLLTYASVGLHPYLNANNFDYLHRNHFFKAKNMDDVLRWTEENGAVESMFKMELGIQSAFKSGKFSEFGKDVAKWIQRNKYDESSIRTIGKKNGLGTSLFNSAAWFMRKSEVMLRSRSFLAHLIKHKEGLNMWGMDLPNDHPWLIELANRGVQATQFLYNNANRPMFAQTSFGKIYSRFQLWTWNSLKFRRDLVRQANEFGWKPNSIEFDRLKRIMTADMFMLALATMFPASLFENSLAPPFSYLQDLSDFFFSGDDEKRERAFYGVLPFPANILQPVSPPSSRILFQTIQLMASGDWDRFGNRFWTWIPFGRLGQSTYRTFKAPNTVIENYTSFPINRVSRLMTKEEDTKKRHNPGISITDIFK